MPLDSGELSKEVLIAPQHLGVETIATGRYDNTFSQQSTDHVRTIPLSGPARIKALTQKSK